MRITNMQGLKNIGDGVYYMEGGEVCLEAKK